MLFGPMSFLILGILSSRRSLGHFRLSGSLRRKSLFPVLSIGRLRKAVQDLGLVGAQLFNEGDLATMNLEIKVGVGIARVGGDDVLEFLTLLLGLRPKCRVWL